MLEDHRTGAHPASSRKASRRTTRTPPPRADDGPGCLEAPRALPGWVQRHRWLVRLSLVGPAFVAGAWQFGPGNLTSAVQAGAGYGYGLIWVIVVSTVLMLGFTDMSVRIGIASPASLVQTVKAEYGRPLGVLTAVGVFFITLMFSVGNAAGSGLALSLLFGGQAALWTVACTVAVAAILVMRNVYRVVERVLVVTVALMTIGFVVSAIVAQPDWAEATTGLLPELPAGSELLVIALVGTNFSLNAAFFTSYATQARGRRADQYRDTTITDTVPGIVAPGVMTALVIVVSAAVLGRTGETAATLPDLARVFEPLAGPVGATVFAVGFFGAAFSSMLANATAGGTLLSDGLGWGGFDALRTKALVGTVLVFGLVVVVAAPGSQVQLIIVAQALTVLVAPLLAVVILLVANNGLMGHLRNCWWQNVLSVLGLTAVLASSVRLVTVLLG